MQPTTLICTLLSLVCFGSIGIAEENTDRLAPPLTPIYVSPSPITSSHTYYPSVATANASPLTVAASTPPRWERVASYVSGALDNLAEATNGAAPIESPATALYTTDTVDTAFPVDTVNSPAAASQRPTLIESPTSSAITPGITPIPTGSGYGTTSIYRPAARVAPACSSCTKVYTPTTVYNPAPVLRTAPGSACCPPAPSACCPPPSSVFARKVVACRPVVETSSMPRDYYVGRGMIGQPVVYVPKQPVRNALRWFFP